MSTPFDPEEPSRRSPLEPTNVLRRRRPGYLSDLVRQVQERERDSDEGYEIVAVPGAERTALPTVTEDDTQELPPVTVSDGRPARRVRPAARGPAHGRSFLLRRTVLGVAAGAAALAGFGAALLLTWDRDAGDAAQEAPPAASSAPAAPSAPPASSAVPGGVDPDGAGTLREGDSGPAVSDLQTRLLRIPDVYDQDTPSGVYDATLTAAVARFQLWYGIRGDETGVYGNDTRSDLESRTAS
ncbi:peptidoglycan-binding domain-containing protein [Streptomyces sp. NPDC048484]|uniref:peptidoglycan-binding domain-containing protein n=1 Tax=Streptomyces sp. NPDC048484 TaxID=3155146 RepID=UPI0034319A64